MTREDKLNFLFNRDLCAIDVEHISLDLHNFDNIDPSVVTQDNIWSLMVLMATITDNSGAQIFYKSDINALQPTSYKGIQVMVAAKECVRVISGKPVDKTVDDIINKK